MSIFNIFLSIFKPQNPNDRSGIPGYWADPMRHPDIAKMDQRQLADLPMPVLPRRNYGPQKAESMQSVQMHPAGAAKLAR